MRSDRCETTEVAAIDASLKYGMTTRLAYGAEEEARPMSPGSSVDAMGRRRLDRQLLAAAGLLEHGRDTRPV